MDLLTDGLVKVEVGNGQLEVSRLEDGNFIQLHMEAVNFQHPDIMARVQRIFLDHQNLMNVVEGGSSAIVVTSGQCILLEESNMVNMDGRKGMQLLLSQETLHYAIFSIFMTYCSPERQLMFAKPSLFQPQLVFGSG